MVSYTLFDHLLGIDSHKQAARHPFDLTPNSVRYGFLEKGHIMEFLLVREDKKKVISLLFGPDEFVIRSHPKYSILVNLDDCRMVEFKYGDIIRLLRLQDTKIYYEKIKEKYEEKVASRIKTLTTMTAAERYVQLKETQPWVFSLLKEEDIASYLGISLRILRSL